MTVKVRPNPNSALLDPAPVNATVTAGDPRGVRDEIHRAIVATVEAADASNAADDLVISVEVRERLARATDESYWLDLEDVMRELGHDPSDFGLGDSGSQGRS